MSQLPRQREPASPPLSTAARSTAARWMPAMFALTLVAQSAQAADKQHQDKASPASPDAADEALAEAERSANAGGMLGTDFDPGPGWTLADAALAPALVRLRFVGPNAAALIVRITPLQPNVGAFARTSRFAIAHEGALQAEQDAAALALLARVVNAVRAADAAGAQLPAAVVAPAGSALTTPAPQGRARFASGSGDPPAPLADAQLGVAALGLALLLAALLFRALPTAFAALLALPERRWLLPALVLAALARVIVAPRLVTMFMGYREADIALLAHDIPRYGAGVHLLHHLALQVLPVDHDSLLLVHRCAAIATLPLIGALVAALARRPLAATAAVIFVGSAPLLVSDAATESNLVPIVLALWTGGWLWWRWLQGRALLDLVGAVGSLAFAMVGRPEQLLVAPLWVAALSVVHGDPDLLRARRGALVAVAVALAAVCVPQVANTLSRVGGLHDGLAPLLHLPVGVIISDVLFWPHWFPLGITALAIAGAVMSRGDERRAQVALWAFALLWAGSYTVDLPLISVPRLTAGSATVICALAGWATPMVGERLRAVGGARGRRGPWLLAAAWLLSVLATLPCVFWPRNQDLEERMMRAAQRVLPQTPACVQRLTDADPPFGGQVHRYHPDYLFRAAGHHIIDLRADPLQRACSQTFVLLGTRCFARDRDTPTAPGANASCQRLRAQYRLEPLWEERAPLRWDDPFDWWREQTGFVVGVYRVAGRLASTESARR